MDSLHERRPIRWGIIGCGNVTEVKSGPPYQMTKDFQLNMVMRRNLELAKDYALRHEVPSFTSDASKIIENPKIDAVYIATPPDTHKYYALKVASVAKPCCLEKPMAPCFADSLEIFEAFDKTKTPLFIAYYRRSLPRFNAIKDWLDSRLIGEVRHILWNKTRTTSPVDISGANNWRTDAKIAPGGYFDDLASHGLNLFSYLLGEIIDAKGLSVNQQELYSAYDSISGTWVHESGVTGSGSWNFGAYRPLDEVKIFGSKGEIHFSVLGEEPICLINEKGTEKKFIQHPKHLHQYHVDNMRKHLFGEMDHP